VEGLGQAFSPDGSEIAFVHENSLWTTDLQDVDPNPVTLALPDRIGFVKWSPDGEWIAFENQSTVWKVSAYGGEPERLLESSDWAWFVGWSGDSQDFYYLSAQSAPTQIAGGWGSIWRVKTATPDSVEYVRSNIGMTAHPALSPDGSFIAAGGLGSKEGLKISRIGDDDVRTIVFDQKPNHQVSFPVIAPSSNRVAFYLVPEWYTNTWMANVSVWTNPPMSLP